MPEARPDRIACFGIALTGHPSSHALPSGGGHELRKGAHPKAAQVAGGAVACGRAVGPPEARTTRSRERRSHTCSAVLAVVS